MSSDGINERLDRLWKKEDSNVIEIQDRKYVIISDIHLGDGGGADDFHKNEKIVEKALDYYRTQGYTLILLGDIEELWQFDLHTVTKRYENTIYRAIREFGNHHNEDCVYRVFGNHDLEWGYSKDPIRNAMNGRVCATESLIMKDSEGNRRILLVHGHQGTGDSDKYAWVSRPFVRLFRYVEPMARNMALYRSPSITKSSVPKSYEKKLYSWAKKNRVLLICGHSHRAMFGSLSYADHLKTQIAFLGGTQGENKAKLEKAHAELSEERRKGRENDPVDPGKKPLPCYFNTGCALYEGGMTAIEIFDDTIRLVKWRKDATVNPEPYQTESLSECIRSLAQG